MTHDIGPVLVLGAGINGAAIARHLVLAGISVHVVDQGDVGGGTTAYSSRLIHGGLRYLEYGEFGLVREALGDRSKLLRLAPHHVQPLQLFIPIAKRSGGWLQAIGRFFGRRSTSRSTDRGRWLIGAGLSIYDQIARGSNLPRHQTRPVGTTNVPAVDPARFRWLCSYWDAQVKYPERYTIGLLTDANRVALSQQLDFHVYTYSRAQINSDGAVDILNVAGAQKPIQRTNIKPSLVVNATGAWGDATLKRLDVQAPRLIGGTKGSHLLIDNRLLRECLGEGGVYAEADDGRPFFLLPFGDQTLVGTTDIPWDSDPATATASEDEISYLIAATNRVFSDVSLTRDDIVMHCAGIRPLPYGDPTTPGAITRRHHFVHNKLGDLPIINVIGGKLTTSDSLASQVTDLILNQFGHARARKHDDRSMAESVDYPQSADALVSRCEAISADFGVPLEHVQATWTLYGAQTADVLESATAVSNGGANDLAPIAGMEIPRVAARWAIRREWASQLNDLVERRLMMLYHHPLSSTTLRDLANILAEEFSLSEEQVERQVEQCVERCQNHFGKQIV